MLRGRGLTTRRAVAQVVLAVGARANWKWGLGNLAARWQLEAPLRKDRATGM